MLRSKFILIVLTIVLVFSVTQPLIQAYRLKNAVTTVGSVLFSDAVTHEDEKKVETAVKDIQKSARYVSHVSSLLYRLIPHEKLLILKNLTQSSVPISENLGTLLGKDKEQNYIVFFLNNREIRPGGGFIGSLAFIKVDKFSLKELRVEDVYEIDGQIKAHVPPHPAVAAYLEVPHLFLRDSNFSPDFAENVKTAGMLLNEAGRQQSVDGAVGITTSTVEDIMGVLGPVYLSDYRQTVSKDNFYIVTQSHVEKDFFPGSIQKRSFLSALMNAILNKLESADKKKLAEVLFNNLTQKNTVLYSARMPVEKELDALGWSGKLKKPAGDYLFPVEANVGANKANYFVRREMSYSAEFRTGKNTAHTFSTQWRNESPDNSFLAGTYKNYFQLYLPRSVTIESVNVDNSRVDNYAVQNSPSHTIISVYMEIEPKRTRELRIGYSSPALRAGDPPYPLTVQKQTGTRSNDVHVTITHPALRKKYTDTLQLRGDITVKPE